MIVTTNTEESAETEEANRKVIKAGAKSCVVVYRPTMYQIISGQMPDDEFSFKDDRAYPDNREEEAMN